MNRLNELQAEVGLMHRSGKVASDAVMAELFALLRAAASETVGTEWQTTNDYSNGKPVLFPIYGTKTMSGNFGFSTSHQDAVRTTDAHNADLAAARLAVANAKAERDAAINLAYQYPPSEPYNPDGVTWRQMYEMLDEKSLGDKHGHDCAVAALTEQRDAALARVAEMERRVADGDTKDTLPPLPVMARVGEIRQGKPSHGPLGEARDTAIEQIARADAERLAAAHADTTVPTRELVARLADIVKLLTEDHGSGLMVAECNAIIADARRGCGA